MLHVISDQKLAGSFSELARTARLSLKYCELTIFASAFFSPVNKACLVHLHSENGIISHKCDWCKYLRAQHL